MGRVYGNVVYLKVDLLIADILQGADIAHFCIQIAYFFDKTHCKTDHLHLRLHWLASLLGEQHEELLQLLNLVSVEDKLDLKLVAPIGLTISFRIVTLW